MSQLVFLVIGLAIGFWLGRNSKTPANKKPVPPRVSLTALERHKAKVLYSSDADRIRELNLLSPNAGRFFAMLKREMQPFDVVIKDRRFFIVDADKFPLAIFEYRDGKQTLRATDTEDGLPVFLYKNLPPSRQLADDKEAIFKR
ncbi:hypothetical protein ACF3NA_00775 [Alkanindiges sp. WGS2144]|uniref:hypothetical protein n=1 Tax=Alkanindiges sp. WGS2144 TaxID=3366808 RepID=UPI003750725E